MKNKFYVYYYLNKNKDTLYVGKTDNIDIRNKNHQGCKKWYEDVNEIFYYNFPDAPTQRMIEIYLINKRKAIHNKVHQYRVVPNIEIKLPKFLNYDPNNKIIKKRITKQINIEKHLEDVIELDRDIEFEDIMWGDKSILINENTCVKMEFINKENKKYNRETLHFFYYESDKSEDKDFYYLTIKDEKQIKIFNQANIYIKLQDKNGSFKGKGILYSSFYDYETLTFKFNKELLENNISPIIPTINSFFSNLMNEKSSLYK